MNKVSRSLALLSALAGARGVFPASAEDIVRMPKPNGSKLSRKAAEGKL